jgi:hypothetical protein
MTFSDAIRYPFLQQPHRFDQTDKLGNGGVVRVQRRRIYPDPSNHTLATRAIGLSTATFA